jgi:hypothetical protein
MRVGTDVESLFERLQSGLDRREAIQHAREAADSAARLAELAPIESRDEWQRLAQDMGSAARQLAVAAETDDSLATRRSAANLYAACVHCHQKFGN